MKLYSAGERLGSADAPSPSGPSLFTTNRPMAHLSTSQTSYMTASSKLPDSLRHGLANGEQSSFEHTMAAISNNDELIAALSNTDFERDEVDRIEKSLYEVSNCLHR